MHGDTTVLKDAYKGATCNAGHLPLHLIRQRVLHVSCQKGYHGDSGVRSVVFGGRHIQNVSDFSH